jgi:hypothetical protein
MTKDDTMKLARKAGLFTHKEVQPELIAFYNLVAASEREACAKLCESHVRYPSRLHFAAAIRARGNT